jgi:phosphate transport system protein
MKNDQLSQHISSQFDSELDTIRARFLAMGGEVEEQLRSALTVLQNRDLNLAEEVIQRDKAINAAEGLIDRLCITLLARRQPTATDLRFVIAVLKAIPHLERIGDEAVKIARVAISMDAKPNMQQELAGFGLLGERVTAQIRTAMDSIARFDAPAAVALGEADREVDAEYEKIIRSAIDAFSAEPANSSRILDTIWIARALERIGDHAKNIGEYVVYIVHGDDVRHASLDDMQRTIAENN